MTKLTLDDRVRAFLALAEKATPAEWNTGPITGAGSVWVYTHGSPVAEPVSPRDWVGRFKRLFRMRADAIFECYDGTKDGSAEDRRWKKVEQNAAFVVAARNDAPGIIRELQAEVDRLRAVLRHTHTNYCTAAWTDRDLHAPECLLYEIEPPARREMSMEAEPLPCGHSKESLILVDERGTRCPECDHEYDDETWMCSICYPNGALPCGHAIESRRQAEGVDPWCVDCDLAAARAELANIRASKSSPAWEADHQRGVLLSIDPKLAEEFPCGCDTIEHVAQALHAARSALSKAEAENAALRAALDGHDNDYGPYKSWSELAIEYAGTIKDLNAAIRERDAARAERGAAVAELERCHENAMAELGGDPERFASIGATVKALAEHCHDGWQAYEEGIDARNDAIEAAAKVVEAMRDGFTVEITCDGQERAIRDQDGPWILNAVAAQRIRDLARPSAKETAATGQDLIDEFAKMIAHNSLRRSTGETKDGAS